MVPQSTVGLKATPDTKLDNAKRIASAKLTKRFIMPPFLLNQMICDTSCYDVTRDRVRYLVAGGDRDHLALTVFLVVHCV
jgi:hypothetical protein